MANYRLTNKAVTDLSDIWHYTCDTWSEKQANKYYLMLPDTYKELAAKPKTGKSMTKCIRIYWNIKRTSRLFFMRQHQIKKQK
jgi:toxin ParE1/3/4